MKSQLFLTIPTPCHENWDQMTPRVQGKFCQSCAKTVVDFTTMSDYEVLNFFNNNKGNTCGRFLPNQLDRGFEEKKIQKQKPLKWLIASLFSLLIITKGKTQNRLVGKVMAKPSKPKTEIRKTIKVGEIRKIDTVEIKKTPKKKFQEILTGEVSTAIHPLKGDTIMTTEIALDAIIDKKVILNDIQYYKPNKANEDDLLEVVVGGAFTSYDNDRIALINTPIQIRGTVVDQNNLAIPYAALKLKNRTNTITKENGEFIIETNRLKNNTTIEISCLGYETTTIVLNKQSNPNLGVIVLKDKIQELQEVIVNSGNNTYLGRISTYYAPTKNDTLTKIKKIFNTLFSTQIVTIYPNPVRSSQVINIKSKKAGEFIIQILDNQSKILKMQRSTLEKNQAIQMQLPFNQSGVLYIRLINEEQKKSWTEKIIISQ